MTTGGTQHLRSAGRFVVAVALPVAAIGLTAVPLIFSAELPSLGPLDKTGMAWVLGASIWSVAAIANLILWSRLPSRRALGAVAATAMVLGLITAMPFWVLTTSTACAYGLTREPIGWVLPALVLGFIVGGSAVVSPLAGLAEARRGRVRSAVTLVGSLSIAVFVVGLLVAGVLVSAPICKGPTGTGATMVPASTQA